MGVSYYVNPAQFAQHPIYESVLRDNPSLGFTTSHERGTAPYRKDLVNFILQPPKVTAGQAAPLHKVPSNLLRFERTVEQAYVQRLQAICRQEVSCLTLSSVVGARALTISPPSSTCGARSWIGLGGSSVCLLLAP